MLAVAVRGGSNLLQSPMSAATNMICHDDDDYFMMMLIMILMVIIKVKNMMVTMKVFCNAKQTKVEEEKIML